jgi:hypothetical protein
VRDQKFNDLCEAIHQSLHEENLIDSAEVLGTVLGKLMRAKPAVVVEEITALCAQMAILGWDATRGEK